MPEEESRLKTDQGFAEVVERYADFAYNVAYRMLGNPHDAEDATQEAFLSAYRAWGRFRGESSTSTWLYRITVNACLMRLRKEKRSRYLVETGYLDRDVADWEEGPERAALNQELQGAVAEGLTLLPPDLRAAVVLRDIQGLSNTEASEALGASVSAVKARLHRGRVLMRKHLDGYLRPS